MTACRHAAPPPSGGTRPTGKHDGPPYCFPYLAVYFGLASSGVYTASSVTRRAVVSYTAIPPLPGVFSGRFLFCCTGLRVAPTGRYPALCPVKPGLSSPFGAATCTAHKTAQHHNVWHCTQILTQSSLLCQTLKQLPPINSLKIELPGTFSLLTPRK